MVAERARSIALVCGSARAERARRVELLVRADEAYRRRSCLASERAVEACETERAERVAEVNRRRMEEVQRAVDARRDAARRRRGAAAFGGKSRGISVAAALGARRDPARGGRRGGAFRKDAALWKRRFSDVKNSLTRDIDAPGPKRTGGSAPATI